MQNRDGLEQFGRLVGTASSGFWTPGRTAVDPSIPYLPLENPIGGGGVTVTPGFGELALAGFAPTIQTPITVTPGFGELTLAGFVPTIQFPVTVTPAAGALQLDGYLPTIQTPVTVMPDVGALTVTGFEPTIQVPAGPTGGGEWFLPAYPQPHRRPQSRRRRVRDDEEVILRLFLEDPALGELLLFGADDRGQT